jgi:hypothetical protein
LAPHDTLSSAIGTHASLINLPMKERALAWNSPVIINMGMTPTDPIAANLASLFFTDSVW